MLCIELRIPPMPQLITVGHAVWTPGMRHFKRNFPVFDLLIVKEGTFYITEEEQEYEVEAGSLLTLEPGLTHYGHRPVESAVDIYWLHFVHPHRHCLVEADQIAWSALLTHGTDADLSPPPQTMYIPKQAKIDLQLLEPLLIEMEALNRSLSTRNALRLHALAGELFSRLQTTASANLESRAYRISEQVVRYLREHMQEPFASERMERELHYHFDYLSRCLKLYTGMSPVQYLHRLQVEKAKLLLRGTGLSVQEIAEQVGQPNGNYFARLFRKLVGMTPREYRSSRRELL